MTTRERLPGAHNACLDFLFALFQIIRWPFWHFPSFFGLIKDDVRSLEAQDFRPVVLCKGSFII